MRDADLGEIGAVRSLRTDVSRLIFLEVFGGANAEPARLVIKAALNGSRGSFNATRAEIRFYADVAPRYTGEGLVRLVGHGVHQQIPFLVLEDITADYASSGWSEPLPPAHCESAIGLLARIHALGWGSVEAPKIRSREAVAARIRNRNTHFALALGDAAGEALREAWRKVFSSGGRPWEPLTQPQHLTVTHGDAHSGTVLHPRAPDGRGVRLIDWQYWHTDAGVRDLAFFMALHWTPELRAHLERPLLERYHQQLLEAGVPITRGRTAGAITASPRPGIFSSPTPSGRAANPARAGCRCSRTPSRPSRTSSALSFSGRGSGGRVSPRAGERRLPLPLEGPPRRRTAGSAALSPPCELRRARTRALRKTTPDGLRRAGRTPPVGSGTHNARGPRRA